VNMPITSDFVVQLLGVVGGRVSPETFINSALPQLTGPVASAISQQLGVPQDQVAEKIQQGQELLPALTALAGALGEARQNGGVPTEAIQQLLNMAGQSGARAAPVAAPPLTWASCSVSSRRWQAPRTGQASCRTVSSTSTRTHSRASCAP